MINTKRVNSAIDAFSPVEVVFLLSFCVIISLNYTFDEDIQVIIWVMSMLSDLTVSPLYKSFIATRVVHTKTLGWRRSTHIFFIRKPFTRNLALSSQNFLYLIRINFRAYLFSRTLAARNLKIFARIYFRAPWILIIFARIYFRAPLPKEYKKHRKS